MRYQSIEGGGLAKKDRFSIRSLNTIMSANRHSHSRFQPRRLEYNIMLT